MLLWCLLLFNLPIQMTIRVSMTFRRRLFSLDMFWRCRRLLMMSEHLLIVMAVSVRQVDCTEALANKQTDIYLDGSVCESWI